MIEQALYSTGNGWVEVICGCMFSGKTEELINRIKQAKAASQCVQIFKPAIDTRYHQTNIVSHNGISAEATVIKLSAELLMLTGEADVVAIDEAQFLDLGIVEVVNLLANQGKRVIIAGLDMDYKGRPFGPMPYLLAISEFVTKLHAICAVSGEKASFTYRTTEDKDDILLGSAQIYQPRNRKHFYLSNESKIL